MITEVSKITQISTDEILGKSRMANIVNVRHVYWFLMFESGFNYSQIARLNNRTEPTVYHGVRKTREMLSIGDKEVKRIYEQVKGIMR